MHRGQKHRENRQTGSAWKLPRPPNKKWRK